MTDDNTSDGECRQALDTLYHFLDGELTAERRALIQRHLDGCSPCLEAYDFEAELKLVVARRCRDQVPESLRLRISVALAEASGSPAPAIPSSGGFGGDGDGESPGTLA